MPAFYQKLVYWLDHGMACLMLDMKQKYWQTECYRNDKTQYARDFIQTLRAHGFNDEHLSRVIFSVPSDSLHTFRAGALEEGFSGVFDSYIVSAYPESRVTYVDEAEAIGANFLGLGRAPYDPKDNIGYWMDWVMEMVNQRDRDGKLKKVYFWTIDNNEFQKQIFDYGMDGLITNRPDRTHNIINSYPYSAMFRKATSQDSLNEVHGFEKLGLYPDD